MPPKSRMVFIILTACLITAWVGESLAASGPDYDEILAQSVQEQLRALELDQLSAFASKIEPDYQQYIPNLDWRAVFSQSSNSFNLIEVLAAMLQTAFKEVIISSRLMRQLLLIGLLTALIRQLQLSVENKELANAAFLACFLVAIYIGLQSFRAALELAYQTVDDMVSFMYALLPLLSTMVASVGDYVGSHIPSGVDHGCERDCRPHPDNLVSPDQCQRRHRCCGPDRPRLSPDPLERFAEAFGHDAAFTGVHRIPGGAGCPGSCCPCRRRGRAADCQVHHQQCCSCD